jgi:UDP-2,4-diacetamido-2,4,6-trideoxy-beta-L-altropyranose hydrolase
LKKILFRCDSSSTIGLGHVKRCLVLAQRLKEYNKNLKILFATQNLYGNINLEILKSGFSIYSIKNNSLKELDYFVKGLFVDLLVIDSYEIDNIFEEQLRINNPSLKILSFDDMLRPHCSHMVLNHGVQAQEKDYKKILDKKTKLFCGSEYTLLRDEFFESKKVKVTRNSVAIILGGNDVLNLSSKIANLLLQINNKYKITVITTSVNPNLKELKENSNIELLVDINNIASVIASKSLVITASGGTFFEVLSLKKKFINIEVASNQKVVDKFLKQKGIKTTIKAIDLTKEVLENRIRYVKINNSYKKLSLKFTKNRLVKKILKELK